MEQTAEVKFRTFQQDDLAEVKQMIFQLYAEAPEGQPITSEKIDNTVRELSAHPEKGRFIVFSTASEIAGYAIVIYYWSNELGGDVLHIDELFVKKAWRNRSIATRFIDAIPGNEQGTVKALQLEVTPSNERALSYYWGLGFESSRNSHLLKCRF
ncbi:MAG: GNAT family N-acetyltransferase [Gammaproteobacteria bacterium]|nr:GNAT family N-acetyltransferase [Gammaproteobacteria bacterium]